MTKIGLVQASACHDIHTNLETLRRFAQEAGQLGCEVICFPEAFLTGYVPEEAARRAIPRNAPVLDQVSETAALCHGDILTGFLEQTAHGIFITHGLFRRDGTREFYRKSHLGRKEAQYFHAGDALEVFSLSCGLRIGIQLCAETHYPDIAQTLALKGAEVIFAPHAVPRVSGDRKTIWGKYIPARSYDNRIYMACCNLWDPDRYGGGCLVTDPRGEVSAHCFADQASLLVCPIDRALVASFRDPGQKRSAHFYPALRRSELYK